MVKVSLFSLALIISSCTEFKVENINYFSGANFRRSVRQWDTFIYNFDTSEFYYGTNTWNSTGIPQNAQIEYKSGICKVKVYRSNKDSGLSYTGFCKVIKGTYKGRASILGWPFKQFVLYEDSVWLAYDKDGNLESREYFKYYDDTLFIQRLVFDTITYFEVQPYPFIGTRDILFTD